MIRGSLNKSESGPFNLALNTTLTYRYEINKLYTCRLKNV